jgi:hypothetical protein
MSWLFSQALVGAYSEGCYSDGEQFAPSSSTNTPAMFLSQGKTTEASNLSRFGMMCELLTESLGAALLTSFQAAFHAKTFQVPATALGLMEKEVVCGQKWPESFARYDHDSASWRTAQTSLFGGLEEYSETWPKWGMMRAGECSELAMSGIPMPESVSGLLPTIVRNEGMAFLGGPIRNSETWSNTSRLSHYLIGLWKNFKDREMNGRIKQKIACHPIFAEWMMGLPKMWSDLQELETCNLLKWLEKHGTSCAKKLGRKKNNMVVCKTSYNSAMLQGLKPYAGGTGTSA